MKPRPIFAQILIVLSVFCAHSQDDPIKGNHVVSGVVKSKSGEIIQGTNLTVQKDNAQRTFAADENGKFELQLRPGNYTLTVGDHIAKQYRLFLTVPESGPIPTGLELVFDPDSACCSDADGRPFPKPLALPRPPFPPAARAVRASGEVVVELKIDRDGRVLDAVAISGHPLLRRAAEAAGRGSRFESLEAEAARSVKLIYVFLDRSLSIIRPRYSNPYRIEVVSTVEVVSH